MHRFLFLCFFLLNSFFSSAQDYRWQQKVDYTIAVDLDVQRHLLTGSERLIYYNNSPDTLHTVYYHLYFNAFQPGSMMDIRSSTIKDPDPRVGKRISRLLPSEIGYQKIHSLKQDGHPVQTKVRGTLLEVKLHKPILPHKKSLFIMEFETQIPIQIRRCGRNNSEGIAYSMTQWYPKMAEYDMRGWHAYPYVGREFHGVWGNFDVTINLDTSYTVAATGVLQNADEIGHGYSKKMVKKRRKKGTHDWHFIARDVIDFAWAADPNYTHDIAVVPNGPTLHFFYQKNQKTRSSWKQLQPAAVQIFQYLNAQYGKYPYETYSIIQGGDGGMEYPMCTLILGEGEFSGVLRTMAHEITHSWFQASLASNESLYAWMDEGFTVFASIEALAHIQNKTPSFQGVYASYLRAIKKGIYETPSTPSDHFITNRGYSVAAYSSGALFLCHLRYIIGKNAFYKGMKRYYAKWSMHHPEPNDFIREMERSSGLQLHWFLYYWIGSTRHIDYAIDTVINQDTSTLMVLRRKGDLPLPVNVHITYKNGVTEEHYIPLNETLGSKPMDTNSSSFFLHKEWGWTNPTYTLTLPINLSTVQKFELDINRETADVDRSNNIFLIE